MGYHNSFSFAEDVMRKVNRVFFRVSGASVCQTASSNRTTSFHDFDTLSWLSSKQFETSGYIFTPLFKLNFF